MAAPPKKICLPPSRAGRKNVALHQHFEASGTVGRLRCKLCFQNWFEKQVAILRSEGKDENEAQAIVKGSVPQPQVFLCFFPPSPLIGFSLLPGGSNFRKVQHGELGKAPRCCP